ncbi:hypothetical protein D3C78_1139610 [compost metagenome]
MFLFHIPQAVLHGFTALAELLDPIACSFDICVIRLGGLHALEAVVGLFFDLYLLEKKGIGERSCRDGDEYGQ